MIIRPIPRLFLHFFDPHFYERRARNYPQIVLQSARLATRIALLAAREVLVPAASYAEVGACRQVLSELSPLFAHGMIQLVGGGSTLEEYALEKTFQYDEGDARHNAYRYLPQEQSPPFTERIGSATRFITDSWLATDSGLFVRHTGASPGKLAKLWPEVPEQLEGRAFTPEYVATLMASALGVGDRRAADLYNGIRGFINKNYFNSYASEYSCGMVRRIPYLGGDQDETLAGASLDFQAVNEQLLARRMLGRVLDASAEELLELAGDADVCAAISAGLLHPPTQVDLPAPTLFDSLGIRAAPPSSADFARVGSGRQHARQFERLVERVFVYAFPATLANPIAQERVDDGRRIIDIAFTNMATKGGVMSLAKTRFGSHKLIVECKNYREDPANPEVDQLSGRTRPDFGNFGILACRTIHNENLLMDRCRDVYLHRGLLIVPLCDRDLLAMVDAVASGQVEDCGYALLGDPTSPLAGKMMRIADTSG